MEKLKGLIAAPFTPMHPDGQIDLDVVPRLVENLVADGVLGAFVCGTTGEGLSLTSGERMALAEAWQRSAPHDFKIIVHVGHASVREARLLAEHAGGIGADGVAAMPSSPFASHTVEDIAGYSAGIAEAAPNVPFFYYHIPSVSGVELPMVDFLRYVGERIPNLAGVKYTHGDLVDYGFCTLLDDGRFDMLFGRDELLLDALLEGARAAVGSTYNFAAPLFRKIIEAFDAGDLALARRQQAAAREAITQIVRFPALAAQKHTMNRVGPDLGPVRPPVRALSDAQVVALDAYLDGPTFLPTARNAATVSRPA